MADYRSWCHRCGAETGFGSHEPWCGKMTREEWEKKEFQENFSELELNILTVDTLYECRLCFAVVRNCRAHLATHRRRY